MERRSTARVGPPGQRVDRRARDGAGSTSSGELDPTGRRRDTSREPTVRTRVCPVAWRSSTSSSSTTGVFGRSPNDNDATYSRSSKTATDFAPPSSRASFPSKSGTTTSDAVLDRLVHNAHTDSSRRAGAVESWKAPPSADLDHLMDHRRFAPTLITMPRPARSRRRSRCAVCTPRIRERQRPTSTSRESSNHMEPSSREALHFR